MSNEPKRVVEQLLNDLNTNLKKDFLFYGAINDIEEQELTSNIVNINLKSSYSLTAKRSYKILYKRSLLKENTNCRYTIDTYEGSLDRDSINEILSTDKNSNKFLKAIMVDSSKNDNLSSSQQLSKNYYFIFEENLGYENNLVYLVIEMSQGNTSDKIFLQDITIKFNDYQNEYKLCCLLYDDKKIYVIFAADSDTLDGEETPFEEGV